MNVGTSVSFSGAASARRWALAGLLLVSLFLNRLSAQTGAVRLKSDLTGTIRDEAGHPLAGATVAVYAAWPKADGGAVANPSCEDCGKRAVADASGRFILKSLDSDALYQVLCAAEGFRPAFFWRLEPAPNALAAVLKPSPSGNLPGSRLHGRVVDQNGNPIPGALVQVYGAHREKEGWQMPPWGDIESLVFADNKGEFVIRADSPFIACDFTVEARGFAKSGRQEEVPVGPAAHTVVLAKGASLKGRLLRDGKPVARAGIGISALNSDVFNRDFSVDTDAEGRFAFANIPSSRAYYLFGIMQSLKDRGALPARRVQAGDEGSVADVGDLNLEPGFTLEGVVRFRDGKPAPPNCTLTLCRTVLPQSPRPGEAHSPESEAQLDSWVIRGIGPEARFRFSGVPAETVSLFIKGPPYYHLSDRNASGDPAGFRLLGRMTANKTNLVFEIVPGEQPAQPQPVNAQTLGQKPLRGAEPERGASRPK